MKQILVLNCGSQSIKYKLFNVPNLKIKKEKSLEIFRIKNYSKILKKELKSLKNYQIEVVGHRVVHGGEKFREPVKITPGILKELEKLNPLAPLHNPFNILGIKIAKEIFKVPQLAVFDTGFFKDLPQKAYIYPLPQKLRKLYDFRRFGFHGISHQYVTERAAKKLKKPLNKLNLITCHLGGGSSITAIKNGKAIDTSMGFTPMEGLMMMTRTGDIDPGIILYLNESTAMNNKQLNYILNYESGMKGICGLSDCKRIVQKVKRENQKAKLALEIYIYRIQKYIGAYFAILKKCNVLVFTGAIGYKSGYIRNLICKDLNILKNTKIMAIETDEELAIAKKIYGCHPPTTQ